MTYMSIRDEINHRIAEGRLFHLPPLIRSEAVGRTMLVTEEVFHLVEPPWLSTPEGSRHASLRADLDTFSEGKLISVSEEPFRKRQSVYMTRTDPVSDEVFDIRSRDPSPGMRVLGCFAGRNIFVALAYSYRSYLGALGSKEWRDFIGRSKAEWRKLFPAYLPHKGDHLRDYVSNGTLIHPHR